MKCMLIYVLVCASLPAQTLESQDRLDRYQGRISGLVLNELRQPVSGITVTGIWPDHPDALFGKMLVRSTRTDAQGRFVLAERFMEGLVTVIACNEGVSYPDTISDIWDGRSSALVEVPLGGQASGIVLVLDPAGRLEVNAKNAATGDVVDRISVHIERDGEPNRSMGAMRGSWSSVGGTLRPTALPNWWLVPTAPIRVCVAAEGFKSAWYGGDGSFGRSVPLKLSARQVFTATVSLQPVNGTALDADGSCFSGRNR